MQQVISVGNQDFKSIRERAGKVIRILKLSWKICFMESRCYNKVNNRTEVSYHMQQVIHLFFYTKKKFQMKIKIIMNQIY